MGFAAGIAHHPRLAHEWNPDTDTPNTVVSAAMIPQDFQHSDVQRGDVEFESGVLKARPGFDEMHVGSFHRNIRNPMELKGARVLSPRA